MIVAGRFKHEMHHWCLAGYFPMDFRDPLARACLRDYAERTPDRRLAEAIMMAIKLQRDRERAERRDGTEPRRR